MRFNIHKAINLRSEGVKVNPTEIWILSVKESHKFSTDEYRLWDLGLPKWQEALSETPNKMTKQEFKKSWSALRHHYRLTDMFSNWNAQNKSF